MIPERCRSPRLECESRGWPQSLSQLGASRATPGLRKRDRSVHPSPSIDHALFILLAELPDARNHLIDLRARDLAIKWRHVLLAVQNDVFHLRVGLLLHGGGVQVEGCELFAERGLGMTVAAMAEHAARLVNRVAGSGLRLRGCGLGLRRQDGGGKIQAKHRTARNRQAIRKAIEKFHGSSSGSRSGS